ncbi:MAG: caspase family protein, partial [Planctomycetes bacterium]|nr:caspase family protein [Planctomycetota bacterium]
MNHCNALVAFCILATVFSAARAAEEPASPGGEPLALVIGIDDYQALGRLTTCRNDAGELARTLVESAGYTPNRVLLLTDDAAKPQNRPTLATMERRIQQVAVLAGGEDSLLIYFSGHGVTREGKGYLVPMDGDERRAVALSWIKETLSTSKARSKVLILDACHAGSAAKGVSRIAPSLVADSTGIVMLLSSAADQVSYPAEDSRHSVFSRYLVDGLSGLADANGDRAVTQAELHEYVRKKMVGWCLETGKTQTPVVFPKAAAPVVLARIPDIPTLSVTAVDAATGVAIAAEVYLDGRRIGAAPVSRRLEKGRSYRVEVKGESSEPYTETLVVSRGGVYSVTASLKKITMRVPAGFRAAPGTAAETYTNTGWAKEVIHEKTGIEMVFIPAGEFM